MCLASEHGCFPVWPPLQGLAPATGCGPVFGVFRGRGLVSGSLLISGSPKGCLQSVCLVEGFNGGKVCATFLPPAPSLTNTCVTSRVRPGPLNWGWEHQDRGPGRVRASHTDEAQHTGSRALFQSASVCLAVVMCRGRQSNRLLQPWWFWLHGLQGCPVTERLWVHFPGGAYT